MADLPLLPTSLVGSYAQPDWLIDRERLRDRFPPRIRATELWRVAPGYLEEAQDDAEEETEPGTETGDGAGTETGDATGTPADAS